MRCINNHYVDPRINQQLDAFIGIATGTDSGTNTQRAGGIFAGQREIGGFLEIFCGDHAAECKIFVNNKHLLNAMLVQ